MEKLTEFLELPFGGGVETNPLQMAQAYAAFANGGLMPPKRISSLVLKMPVVRSSGVIKLPKRGDW